MNDRGDFRRPRLDPEQLFSPFDRALGTLHERLFGRYRLVTVAASILIYSAAVLSTGASLGVSTNYFVLLPVICASMGYGLFAGVVAGIVALPGNLLLYRALGHPEFAPASKAMAELSGILVGTVLGYLSDYHRKLEVERYLRKETESELRRALRDREALFREVHHRVKNNLNLIKSIIGLQARRSADPAFKDAAAMLTGRIMSISFVHERLYRTSELSAVAVDEYLKDLVNAVVMAAGGSDTCPTVAFDLSRHDASMDVAGPVALIVKELVKKSNKHGQPRRGRPLAMEIRLSTDGDELSLSVRDDGVGLPGVDEGRRLAIEEAVLRFPGSLGLTLLDLMASQLGGKAAFSRSDGWTEFNLIFRDAAAAERP